MMQDAIPHEWVDITSAADLTPTSETASPIFKVWCVTAPSGTVTIEYYIYTAVDGSGVPTTWKSITVPATAFAVGAVYPGLVRKLTFASGVFKGAKAERRPHGLNLLVDGR
jgi:hypothetical protein